MKFSSLSAVSIFVSLGLTGPSLAGGLEPIPCSILRDPAEARECMLSRQIEDTKISGDRVGSADAAVKADGLTEEERLAALRARQQMAAMANEQEARVALGPVGSGGGIGAVAPLLLLLLVFGLGGGSGSSGGPISPS